MTRVAVVTGGGRGIGRAIARALTAAGYAVAITGRTASTLDEAVGAGDAAVRFVADAADREAMEDVVRRVELELGPLDLVVANAGRFTAAGPLADTDPELWWADLEVNLRGPMLALRLALPGMVARGSGCVIALGSGIGLQPMPFASAYATAKAALMRMFDSVSGELEGTGVSVFVISPGLVATQLTDFPESYLVHYPDWRGLAQREGVPPELAADLVVRLAEGGQEALSGRFVRPNTDLTAAAAAVQDDEDAGLLSFRPLPSA